MQPLVLFGVSGAASATAVIVTNPLEVVKSRFQVQGELNKMDGNPYKHVFQTLRAIARNEGIIALQQGLGPALLYQLIGNGIRLSTFEQLQRKFNPDRSKAKMMGFGVVSGVVSSCIAQPFYMAKVRMQVVCRRQVSGTGSVGDQHLAARGGLLSLWSSVLESKGPKGLWAGIDGAIVRSVVGGSVQLTTYSSVKQYVDEQTKGYPPIVSTFIASLCSGFAVVTAMNPHDVAATRLANQQEQRYKFPYLKDCLQKTYGAEGISGLFKGWVPNYLRTAPYTTLMFIFFEQYKAMASNTWSEICGAQFYHKSFFIFYESFSVKAFQRFEFAFRCARYLKLLVLVKKVHHSNSKGMSAS